MPTLPRRRKIFLRREAAYLHTMIIEGVDFQQVHYGELDGRALLPSQAAEVEPLRVILRIRVSIQVEDILKLGLPDGLLHVSTFKLRVK
jgi:hypothetical protein